MIVKTLDKITPEILDKTWLIQILYIDPDYDDSYELGDNISFLHGRFRNDTQWYIQDDKKGTEKPISVSEIMKILKQKYDYYNKKYKYFAIAFNADLTEAIYVTPRPHPELCDSGISVISLDDDDAFEKIEKAVGGFNGHRTSAPRRRAAPKKRAPAVKVNVRKMF